MATRQMVAEGAALLRTVLRTHRECLPAPVRALGDGYVLSEFRAVADKARKGELVDAHAASFREEWIKYVAHVRARAGGGTDANAMGFFSLEAEQLAAEMSDEQRVSLAKLQQEAFKIRGGGSEGDDSP
eukprot:PRCOL_00000659-RA